MQETRVFIVDDHELVRYGLRAAIEGDGDMIVVGEAECGEDALDALHEIETDLVLLDLRMPGIGGVETCRRLLVREDAPRVVILTSYDDDEEIIGVLEAGAVGYLMKDSSPAAILQALRDVSHGQTVLDSGIARRVIRSNARSEKQDPAQKSPLTSRETAVLELMVRGYSNKQIAQELWISEPTVKSHVSHILHKMGTPDRTKAVVEAIRLKLVEVSEGS